MKFSACVVSLPTFKGFAAKQVPFDIKDILVFFTLLRRICVAYISEQQTEHLKMESVHLDMDGIFEDGDDHGEDFPSTLPDLPAELEPLGEGDEDVPLSQDPENADVLAKLKGMKGAGKKVVRRPQPKLDASRLSGDRGIPLLPRVFKDVKFKGRGHEADDLRVMMKYLEHWAHRLFPMMPFDEVLERIEKLGTKKEVQTCIKKMRLDIPILKDDFVDDNESDKEQEEEEEGSVRRGLQDFDAEEAFDEIMREEQEKKSQSQQAPLTSLLATPTTPAAGVRAPVTTPVTTPSTTLSSTPNGMTPEQKERMERNKRLAMEKRAARLAQKAAESNKEAAGSAVSPAVLPAPDEQMEISKEINTEDRSDIDPSKHPDQGDSLKNDSITLPSSKEVIVNSSTPCKESVDTEGTVPVNRYSEHDTHMEVDQTGEEQTPTHVPSLEPGCSQEMNDKKIDSENSNVELPDAAAEELVNGSGKESLENNLNQVCESSDNMVGQEQSDEQGLSKTDEPIVESIKSAEHSSEDPTVDDQQTADQIMDGLDSD
ncbi:TIMELESS-interacting protein-like isoform X1 [Haliotis rubra]|uniref:TIMELESS-interacting protein-like isoform X1 n=1 Tax=Haliotis rubra TaxID=36100 RepID=UPI001EE532E5|nr:TIMELESS-interacting protein-like isoform X1 [Haliotis rubra]